MMNKMSLVLAGLFVAFCTVEAFAQASVPGATVNTFVPSISRPIEMTFDPLGNLYVGNDSNTPNVKIRKVNSTGSTVVDFGPGFDDPDAVIFDQTGRFSGTPNSVLVGGQPGYIKAVHPDQTSSTIFSSGFSNPTEMKYDNSGRLLFTDWNTKSVYRTSSSSETPYPVFSVPDAPYGIAINSLDHIFVGMPETGKIQEYDSNGNVVNANFVTLEGGANMWSLPLAFGRGGFWGTDLYTFHGGELIRIDFSGNPTIVGSGFLDDVGGIVFGSDGSLYASYNTAGAILQITVPESSTLALLGMGAFGLLAWGWRRNHKAI